MNIGDVLISIAFPLCAIVTAALLYAAAVVNYRRWPGGQGD